MKDMQKLENPSVKENQRAARILESIPDALISLDHSWCCTYLNKAAEKVLGCSRGELLGRDFREACNFPDSERIYSGFQRVWDEGLTISFEEYFESADTWFELEVFPSGEGISVILRDINDKKTIEKNLNDSRHDLNHAQAVAKTGSWRLLVRQDKLQWSDETYRIFGIPAGTEMTYDLFLSAVHPDDREFVKLKWSEALQTGDYNIEHRIIAQGAVKWVNEKAELEFDTDGSLKGGFGTVQDITERKQAEDNIKAQKSFQEQILESVPFAYWIVDKQGAIIYANKKAEELWQGVKYVDISKFHEYKTWYHDTKKLLGNEDHAVSRAINKGEVTYQELLDIQCFDGTIKSIFNYCTPFYDKDGSIIGALDINQDVTDFIRLQEELKLSEERFRMLALATFEGIVISENGYIIEANEQFARMHGYEVSEVTGKHISEFQHQEVLDFITEKIETGEEYIGEFRDVCKDGSDIIVETHGRTFYSAGRKLRIAALRDITERKKSEVALQQAVEALKRSNTDLEQFAYVASHDLQEPLRMLAYFSKLLANKYKGSLDSKADEYISYIIDSAKRMQSLISDLLSYARITSRPAPPVSTDINVIIDEISRDLQLIILETGTEIICSRLPVVKADPVQIKQVFQNLITNSIKFRKGANPEIHISAELNGDYWVFRVKDNGIGIAPQFFDKVFVIFQRLHNKEQYPGTGIGLAICKKIIERHGGSIWVESEEGMGASFYFTLPG